MIQNNPRSITSTFYFLAWLLIILLTAFIALKYYVNNLTTRLIPHPPQPTGRLPC